MENMVSNTYKLSVNHDNHCVMRFQMENVFVITSSLYLWCCKWTLQLPRQKHFPLEIEITYIFKFTNCLLITSSIVLYDSRR